MTGANRRVAATLLLLGAVLAGCTPLYLPPVPASAFERPAAPLPGAPDIAGGTLTTTASGLRLELRVAPPVEAGYLAVQWFDPRFVEVAAQSVWLDAASETVAVVVVAPPGVGRDAGRWRAVVSDGSRLLRQFAVDVAP